jgi:segregation and condensation protein A
VTLQFLAYVEQIKDRNLEMASEYLLMAAMLIQIKSRLLLPQQAAGVEDVEVDPRAELVRRLLEYEQIKEAAGHLGDMPVLGKDIFEVDVPVQKTVAAVFPSVCPDDLKRAWAEILNRAKLERKHHISREELSVREHMSMILRKLKDSTFVEFNDMFDIAGGVPVVVVHFVAMLELAKETMVEITQAEPFAPIYIRLAAPAE